MAVFLPIPENRIRHSMPIVFVNVKAYFLKMSNVEMITIMLSRIIFFFFLLFFQKICFDIACKLSLCKTIWNCLLKTICMNRRQRLFLGTIGKICLFKYQSVVCKKKNKKKWEKYFQMSYAEVITQHAMSPNKKLHFPTSFTRVFI